MPRFHCSGWWEQAGLGRQPMQDFQIAFEAGQFNGQGRDIVGRFEITGELVGPQIELRKQYIGQHLIVYHGTGDGEGIYSGTWTSNGIPGGRWLIRFLSLTDAGLGATSL